MRRYPEGSLTPEAVGPAERGVAAQRGYLVEKARENGWREQLLRGLGLKVNAAPAKPDAETRVQLPELSR